MYKIKHLLILGLIIFATSVQSYGISDYERRIIAAVLTLEAGNQEEEGMKAVLNVIYNRADRKIERIIPVAVKKYQFSCLNSMKKGKNPDYSKILQRAYRVSSFGTAMQLTRDLEAGKIEDNTFGANHYHATLDVPPYWTRSMQYLTTIGEHHFYTGKIVLNVLNIFFLKNSSWMSIKKQFWYIRLL